MKKKKIMRSIGKNVLAGLLMLVCLGLFGYLTVSGPTVFTGLAIFDAGNIGEDNPQEGKDSQGDEFSQNNEGGESLLDSFSNTITFLGPEFLRNETRNTNQTRNIGRGSGSGGFGGIIDSTPAPPVWKPRYGKFRGGRNPIWENFADPSNVCDGNAVLHIAGLGMIRWKGCVNARFADFDRDVKISPGNISVDSSLLHASFNSSAEVTMQNISFDYVPGIYRDGTYCHEPECRVVSYSEGQFVFEVSSFSSYTLGSNAALDIWDESDIGKPYSGVIVYPNQDTLFFANYTNLTDSTPVTTASCAINFSDSNGAMTYNSTKGLYEYNRSFSAAGFYGFNISCTASGFAPLNTSDFANVRTLPSQLTNAGPSGANITVGTSTRGNSDAADSLLAFSGNITTLDIFGRSITQNWQGYYGNVSGTIQLAEGNGSVLYNWSVASPSGEVYASRSSGVNFANISCANGDEISNEENHLSQNGTEVDSITNTFTTTNHPLFYIGTTTITQNTCNSANIFDTNGAQNTSFYEVLLADNSGTLVYTSLLEQDQLGFNDHTHDFEMIVGEDGRNGNTAITNYYFYVELN